MTLNYKLIALALFLLGTSITCLTAQENIKENHILTKDESGESKGFVAKKSIKCQYNGTTGFKFKADENSSFYARIDPGLIFPPNPETYVFHDGSTSTQATKIINGISVTGTQTVGAIPGQFGVTPTGGASYTIPIDCPAGINGMQPNISLVYNSQGGNGIAGFGWSINGLSAISKTAKNIYSDGAISGINLTENEKYALDGNALLPLTGIYGGNESTYQTELKTYTLIKSKWTEASYENAGTTYPTAFYVTSKDGQLFRYTETMAPVYEYGTNSLTKAEPVLWCLKSVTDANGNNITYNYINETGITPTLSTIVYGDIKIAFYYDTKIFCPLQYIDKYFFRDKYILRKIRVIVNGLSIKSYDFNYKYNSLNQKYFLTDITLNNDDDFKLNPTVIEWGADNIESTIETTSVPYQYSSIYTLLDKTFMTQDVDGDGITDIINVTRVKTSTIAPHTMLDIFKGEIFGGKYSVGRKIIAAQQIGQDINFSDLKTINGGFTSGEFDGDGKKTVIIPEFVTYGTTKQMTFKNLFGQVLFEHNLPLINDVSGPYTATPQLSAFAIGDINNDGIDEIISIDKAAKLNTAWVRISNRGKIFYIKDPANFNEFTPNPSNVVIDDISLALLDNPKQIIINDFNTDGLKDLLVITNNNCCFFKNNGGVKGADGVTHVSFSKASGNITEFCSTNSTFTPADFNGDGALDFLINTDGNQKIAFFNHNWEFDYSSVLDVDGWLITSSNGVYIVTDFNHDGKSDLVVQTDIWGECDNPLYDYRDPDSPPTIPCITAKAVNWYISKGSRFELVRTNTFDVSFDFCSNYLEGDFNVDGKSDFITISATSTVGTDINLYSTYNTNLINQNINFEANLVKSITDGMGVKTEITYRPLTHPRTSDNREFYSYDSDTQFPSITLNPKYPILEITAPLYCVQSVKQPIDGTNVSTTEYSYSGLKVHLIGKGFLGFTSQTTSNAISNTKIVSTTTLEFPYCLPKNQTVVTYDLSNNKEISSTETKFSNAVDANKVYSSVPSLILQKDALKKITSTTDQIVVDNATGNMMSKRTVQGDLTTTLTYEYDQFGTWAWCANKLTKEKLENKLSSTTDTYTRERYFNYDSSTGNLIQEVADPNDLDNKITTTYSDFDRGRPKTTTVVTPGCSAKTTSVKFTNSGRFIQEKTNYTGEKTVYDWNEQNSTLNWEKDNLDRVTNYIYNSLGQLTQTLLPNGVRKVNLIHWANPDNSFGAKYYSYSETSGTSPIKVWYDGNGREIVKETTKLGNKKVYVYTKYLSNGKIAAISEPTYVDVLNLVPNEQWAATYTYNDPFGRVTKVVTPFGETTTEYIDAERKVKETSPEGITIVETNTSGQNYKNTINGKTVTNTYYPSGLIKTTIPQDGKTITMFYDLQGNRTKIEDPNAGIIESKYNGFGQLIWEKQTIQNKNQYVLTTNNYNDNGTLNTIVREKVTAANKAVLSSETTSYIYDDDPKHKTRVKTIIINDTNKQTFTYDTWDRVTNVEETIGTKVLNRGTEYDYFGRVRREMFPTGYYTINSYDDYSNLIEVTDNTGRKIWTVVEDNAKGQILKAKKGGRLLNTTYYDNGLAHEIKSDAIVNLEYVFDSKLNLYSREDKLDPQNIQKEVFGYDALNRLNSWTVNRDNVLTADTMTYDELTEKQGNIINKSDLKDNNGNLVELKYGEPKASGVDFTTINPLPGPHALTSIVNVPSTYLPVVNLNVSYTDFKKIATLSEGAKYYTLSYGVDDQRRKSEYYANGQSQSIPTLTRYYMGDYEEEIDAVGTIRKIHYLSGAILIQEAGQPDKFYYSYSDFQGSLIALVNEDGTVAERYAYDPWGARRNPDNWNEKDSRTTWIVNRGYTGHEHLDAFGIINMNGRVYDPVTAQFFSPDPYIQAPNNWLNYNRYAYCINNPFKYTDPSGYWWGIDDLLVAGAGFIFNYVSYGISTGNWGSKAVAAGGIGAFMGWIGYNTAGLGTVAWAPGSGIAPATGNFIGSMAINSVANQIMPSMNIPISQNFSIGISPSIGLGANGLNGGISMNAAYQNENGFGMSVGLSATNNYLGGGIGAKYKDVGAFYGLTKYGNAYSVDGKAMTQWVGAAGFNIGKFSFQIQNDFLAPGKPKYDRWRTGAYEFGWAFTNDFSLSLGTNIITNDPKNSLDRSVNYDGNNEHYNHPPEGVTPTKFGAWNNGKVYTSPLYLGIKYGNKVGRIGYSHSSFQNFSQNELVHRNGFLGLPFGYQNFYKNYSEFNYGFYSYYGGYQPHSLWGY